jgi:hypothetical protein
MDGSGAGSDCPCSRQLQCETYQQGGLPPALDDLFHLWSSIRFGLYIKPANGSLAAVSSLHSKRLHSVSSHFEETLMLLFEVSIAFE